MKVLLVDDESKFASALAQRLTIRGIETDWTASPQEALAKASEQDYDVAVLDVKMPHIGGIDLKKQLQDIAPGLKFIFITGHGSEEDYEAGRKEVAFYIGKPFKIDVLVEKIQEVLDT
jgi:DNA-binding response OmpR family regulator